MAFSPRARPDTVHLAFSDADVTDTYRDERSSAAASSPRARHPRGDTPLSRRHADTDDTGTSPGRWSVSRRSASELDGANERDDTLRELSNLDKLLVLLDGDEPEESWMPSPRTTYAVRSVGISTPPPTVSRSSSRPPAPTTIRRQDVSRARPASSSRPPESTGSASVVSTTTTATDSPSMRAARSASFRPSLSGRAPSAVELLQRANGFSTQRDGLPDSPSPRPGSVAALRKSEADRSVVEGKGKERAYEAGERTDVAINGSAEEYEGTVASVDSITRVAEAALHEFDTIVSGNSHGRPASRLRHIPSPPSSAAPLTNLGHPPSTAAPPGGHPHAGSFVDDGDEAVYSQLVQELRDAQDYIAYLQNELNAINGVVLQLRERPEPERASDAHDPRLQHAAYEQDRVPPLAAHEQVEATTQAAFDVVKHTLAMLPSLPSSSSSSAPALHSLHRALAFTRSVDQLAHRSPHLRRDEDVFAEENVRGVLRAVAGWAARDEP